MKTILPVTVLFLSCITTFAQINDPVWKPRDFMNIKKEEPAQIGPAKSIEHSNLEQKPSGLNKGTSTSSNFNPAWANRLQTVLDSVMRANPASKGASMAVYTPEEGMWTGVSGISHPGVPITPGMRFGIGSNTKLFVAVSILKLQEEGVLTLDDHLNQWLPPIKNVDSNTTIRQLLTHQSGIFDYCNDRTVMCMDSIWADTTRFWSAQEILATLGKPHFTPGNGHQYSNTNYLLAAMVIEAATGKTWVQKLHDLIFDPLNLDSTFVGAFEPRNGPVAAELDADYNILITNSPMTAEFSQIHAGGAILSTASEMVQWYKVLFSGSLISKESLKMLLSFDRSSLYGLGIWENELYTHNYYHFGFLSGYASLINYDIRRKAIICLLFNDRNNFFEKILSINDVFFLGYPKRTNDAELITVIAPLEHYCSDTITPKVELKNNGSSSLSSVSLNYKIDNDAISVFNWTGLLNPGKTTTVSLPSIIPGEGSHEFTCYTTLPNGQPDGYNFNDTLRSNFYVNVSTPAITELYEGFDGNGFPREGWTLNSSSILQWGVTPLTGLNGSGAAVANSLIWSGKIGQYRDLQLPLLNISNLNSTNFSFDYAYSPTQGNWEDSLQVSVSADCGQTWQKLFYKGGYSLRTTIDYHNNINNLFYPASSSEWKHVSFSLAGFEGNILIRFRARYGNSNNLYIDNIRVGLPVGVDELAVGGQQPAISVFPNPFYSYITIKYDLEHSTDVNLTIYNHLGQQVKNLVNESQPKGGQQVQWNAEGLPAGIYFCRMKAGKQFITQKIVKM
jgi:CubicO group peptidase (beta-lactamase class C family)